MPRLPLSESGYHAALFALPFVCLFIFLFNAYKLGRLNRNWYRSMSEQQRKKFRKIIMVSAIGVMIVLLIPIVFHMTQI